MLGVNTGLSHERPERARGAQSTGLSHERPERAEGAQSTGLSHERPFHCFGIFFCGGDVHHSCPMFQQQRLKRCLGGLLARSGSVVSLRWLLTASQRETRQRRCRRGLRRARCMILRRACPTDTLVGRQHYQMEIRVSIRSSSCGRAGKMKVADSAFATAVVGMSTTRHS